jgi:hypothetical protein
MTTRPTRRALLILPAALAFVGAALVLASVAEVPEADASEKLVATSICEAHELKARKERDPQLEIEIPAEFQQPWPTAEACRSYVAAGDPEAPGPLQPIAFSHKHHAGLYEIECQYCHSNTDVSASAGVPSVEVCMGCHAQFPPSYDSEFEGIRVLKQHWEEKRPIAWEQVYRLPEHVQFQHNAHLRVGFECQTCHGAVEEMDKLYMTEETHWWPWLLPTSKPEMGWCINCHRQNDASQDCYVCHY